MTWAQVRELNQSGIVVASRDVFVHPPPADEVPAFAGAGAAVSRELTVGVLIGGLALLEIVLLAGPAFAVSARRRQRQLALVAANGGTPAHVRRIVLADGVVLGLAGAVVGLTAGVVAAFAARPFVEEYLAHSRAGAYRVFPWRWRPSRCSRSSPGCWPRWYRRSSPLGRTSSHRWRGVGASRNRASAGSSSAS